MPTGWQKSFAASARKNKAIGVQLQLEKAIRDAAWNGQVNQEYTSEVAKRFNCSTRTALRILSKIVTGESGDERFKLDTAIGGVFVANGHTFTHCTLEGRSHVTRIDTGHVQEYCWFLT